VQSGARRASGKVVALSPAIDPDTRSAKAIAEIDNRSGEWKLGDFVSAQLIAGQQAVSLLVPREAIQTVKGAKVVFVSRGGGFKMRPVTTGREVSTNVEIISGLEFAETIATKGTFVLKAELGKAEAEHEH
jgi:cobalt-zinc-cadmium efflux system membrane fusion protein